MLKRRSGMAVRSRTSWGSDPLSSIIASMSFGAATAGSGMLARTGHPHAMPITPSTCLTSILCKATMHEMRCNS